MQLVNCDLLFFSVHVPPCTPFKNVHKKILVPGLLRKKKILYLHIFFLMAVDVTHQLCILESMDGRKDQQDGGQN